jgi:hypothetical protein
LSIPILSNDWKPLVCWTTSQSYWIDARRNMAFLAACSRVFSVCPSFGLLAITGLHVRPASFKSMANRKRKL